MHTTRMVPKRADELVDAGSLYWVIRGQIMCRETISAIRPFVDKEGVGRCRIVMVPKVVLIEPRPFRAFQGWRYLEPKDAPRDLRPARRARRAGYARGLLAARADAARAVVTACRVG